MASTRTQVYLTPDQRRRIDELMRREHLSLAYIIRAALDSYLGSQLPDRQRALDATFGTMPELAVPARDEWDRDSAAR
jgi:hypothetical protein